MAIPVLHPKSVIDGKGPGVDYRIEGDITPTLHVKLDGSMPVMFEHHIILWKQPAIDVSMMKLAGSFKRAVSGLNIFMTQAQGVGEIAFSRDHPGQLFALNLAPGQTVLVREHQFLAVTTNAEYSFERVRGVASLLAGGQGFFVDKFTGGSQGSVLWLHAYGNAFDIDLQAGETIDVEPGSWVYRDQSVTYEQKVFGLKTGLLGGGGNMIFNRLSGPGHVGLQSGFFMETPAPN
ncbi:MAG: AIM24 family protein [Actinomycetes bacterium]